VGWAAPFCDCHQYHPAPAPAVNNTIHKKIPPKGDLGNFLREGLSFPLDLEGGELSSDGEISGSSEFSAISEDKMLIAGV
jgi:hypothetical protein